MKFNDAHASIMEYCSLYAPYKVVDIFLIF